MIAAVFMTVALAAPASARAGGWFSAVTIKVKPVEVVVRAQSAQRTYLAAIARQLATPLPTPITSLVTNPASFVWPVKQAPILSSFGPRGGRLHQGVDLDGDTGEPILAAQAGTVEFVGWMNGYGNTVVIDHGHGIETLYAHQSRMAARAGQVVAPGQLIGYIGSTGRVTAPHLHYEVHINGVPRNPANWL